MTQPVSPSEIDDKLLEIIQEFADRENASVLLTRIMGRSAKSLLVIHPPADVIAILDQIRNYVEAGALQ